MAYLAIAASIWKVQVVIHQTMKHVLHGRRPVLDDKNADHRLKSIETMGVVG